METTKLQKLAAEIVAMIEEIAAIGLKCDGLDVELLNAIQDEAKRLEADYAPETERNDG